MLESHVDSHSSSSLCIFGTLFPHWDALVFNLSISESVAPAHSMLTGNSELRFKSFSAHRTLHHKLEIFYSHVLIIVFWKGAYSTICARSTSEFAERACSR